MHPPGFGQPQGLPLQKKMLKTINGITYYSSPKLECLPGIVHAFLGRTGGVSSGHLASLNMGRREEDRPENLSENKKIIAQAFGIDISRLFTASQVHGDRILTIDRKDITPEEFKVCDGDAIITNIKGISIGILTADCVPVLLFDPKKGVVGAVHAGWKGTALQIAKKCIRAMQDKFGTDPGDITAAIGPAISLCCYKVQDEVVVAVGHIDMVTKPCEFHWCLDLPKANLIHLQEAGVTEIDISGICTSCNFPLFYSHRKERGLTGRQLSFITLTA